MTTIQISSSPTTTQPPRHICWVTLGHEKAGGQQATINLILAVQRLGWKTSILALQPGALVDVCQARGLPIQCLNVGAAPTLPGNPLKKIITYLRGIQHQRRVSRILAQQLQTLQPDAVHFMWSNLLVAAGSAAQRLHIPAFYEIANAAAPYPFQLNRRIMQWQAHHYNVHFLANSQYTASSFGDRPVKPVIFYLGVDTTRFNPDTVQPISRQQLNIPPNATVMAIIGRLLPIKGQELMIRALSRVIPSNPNLHLLILGLAYSDQYRQHLQNLIASLNLTQNVHILGAVPNPEAYYPVIDVAINSRIDPEPFGLSVVEAMMMQRPVLVHALGGPAEIVQDGITGWHMTSATEDAYAQGLKRVLADQSRWPQMGLAARQHALTHFTTDQQARRYAALVESHLPQNH